jgi:hypothetical protein
MRINPIFILLAVLFALFACDTRPQQPSIVGTWELISATTTEKDSTFSTFNPTLKFIKIINQTHFAFLSHPINRDKDSTTFTAGGGSYTLADSLYTEQLDYYSDRQWEGHTFAFVVRIANDTLTQKGVEKVDKLGIDRVIVETYRRVK